MLKIILADDDALVRESLKTLLTSDHEVEWMGEASDETELLALMEQGTIPDILILALNAPEMNSVSLLKSLKNNYDIKTITHSVTAHPKVIAQCFIAGASAYLLKSDLQEEMVFALKQVAKGRRYLSAQLTIDLLAENIKRSSFQALPTDLSITFSSREMEVLHLIAEGLTNIEMSDRLFLSKRTIEGHRQSLIEKTGCCNTAAMIKFAVLNGIIQ